MLEELKEVKDKINWFEKEGNLPKSMQPNLMSELTQFNNMLDRLMLTCMAINKSNIR